MINDVITLASNIISALFRFIFGLEIEENVSLGTIYVVLFIIGLVLFLIFGKKGSDK